MEVYSLNEAMRFFLENSSGNCVCIKDGVEFVAECYPEAKEFFNT